MATPEMLRIDTPAETRMRRASDARRMTIISQLANSDQDVGSESSTEEDSSEEEEENRRRPDVSRGADVPPEYWLIQKLVKYMKAGNQTATIVALCCLKDHDLSTEINQQAIRDSGGLEVLVNLLETADVKCKLAALSVMSAISYNSDVRRSVTDLGGVPLLVHVLSDPGTHLQILAADTLANVARVRQARSGVRNCGGIPKLVDLLDASPAALATPIEQLSFEEREQVAVARAGAKALWSLSQSRRNKEAMRRAGCVRLLALLLRSVHLDLVVPVMGTIQQCASEISYQLAIQTEGMVVDLVRYLSHSNRELKKHCASAIFKCSAADEVTRELVREHGGLDPLVALASDKTILEDKPLLAAVTGALWKCALSNACAKRLDELCTVEVLVTLLDDENEEVLTNVVGGLAALTRFPENRVALRHTGGLPPLMLLLSGTNEPMLENVAVVIGECANEPQSMQLIDELDGVRLVWSLLKNPSPRVQASAAWALCPCIDKAKNSGEMVRSFVGGLELIVSLLRSPDNAVLACVCAALAKIAQDRENLAVITDHGVVSMLAELVLTLAGKRSVKSALQSKRGSTCSRRSSKASRPVETTPEDDDRLRQHLAEAIAYCCSWGGNAHEFGRLGSIGPLVGYMGSTDVGVHRSTARALHHLSFDAQNCIAMHQSGVVAYLLQTIGSADETLQEASAGCLSNIRKLALSGEKFY